MESEETMDGARRVRSLLKMAAKRNANGQEGFKERRHREIEFFKRLFMDSDARGKGMLCCDDIIRMFRKQLKIAPRLVTDGQLRQFFAAVDSEDAGDVDFSQFLSFVQIRERNSKLNEMVLKQVKRAVRLAIQRQRMTLAQLEQRFHRCAEEGIIDTAGGDGGLGPEEMRRFFRKVLDVSMHEAPDRNLVIAFKAMDEDGGGTLDAEEFMDFIREAIQEETTLCPPGPQGLQGEPRPASLLAGMRGVLPDRLPKDRPGTTYSAGKCCVPFCRTGRELETGTRLYCSMPSLLKKESLRPLRVQTPVEASLLPTGLPKSALASTTGSRGLRKTWSTGFLTTMGSFASSEGLDLHSPTFPTSPELSLPDSSSSTDTTPRTPNALPPLSPAAGAGEKPLRGTYHAIDGMLRAKDADALNRIEQRLFNAGVDVRGLYHAHG